MSQPSQYSIRALFLLTALVAVSLTVSRVLDLSIVRGVCAIGSFPAFLLGPFLLIWGAMDWRPVREHKRIWYPLAISFALLLVNPWMVPMMVLWWFANIPGYLVFSIVANFDGRQERATRQQTSAERIQRRP
jgi:hypothetical protein